MNSLEVKICGITREDDALASVLAGASALGFVFYPASARYVTIEQARKISQLVAGRISLVGVFVDFPADNVKEISRLVGLDFLQFHGRETPEYCSLFPRERIIKAIHPSSAPPAALLAYPVRAFLIDSGSPSLPGGTGRTTDWAFARQMADQHDVILAGGLSASNIAAAWEEVRPLAVDLSSGLELSPGIKSHNLIEQFMNIIAAQHQGRPARAPIFRRDRPIYP